MKRTLLASLVFGLAFICNGHAASARSTEFKTILSGVPAAEMPARAGELVKAAKAKDRNDAAVQAVSACMELNEQVASAVVAAIAKAVPENAPAAAAGAAQKKPQLSAEIARAAAAAAPRQAAKIVAAVCRVVPSEYKRVAIAVAEVVPGEGEKILRAVASAIPGLRNSIETVLTDYQGRAPSVAAVLDSPKLVWQPTTDNAQGAGTSTDTRGPTIAPPYVPYPGTTSGVRPSDSGPVPRGGRDYASP